MEKNNVVRMVTTGCAGIVSAVAAWLFARLGILLYVIVTLAVMMCIDYLTGMLASKYEAIDHPNDANYGWNSKKGAKGIIKKVGYLCVITVAIVVDYIIMQVAETAGIETNIKAFFGLLVTVWYLLNELLSIIENVGRMGAPVPEWLTKYIAVLKNKIDTKGGE
ncbi:MAG: phage holin family protein [Lachnospiraceae bacterium]|nr:phage holin family protein [Lachnospiraceae bacterium]MBP3477604.1 phage holin family protein [Lachnospiraceae bacterium]